MATVRIWPIVIALVIGLAIGAASAYCIISGQTAESIRQLEVRNSKLAESNLRSQTLIAGITNELIRSREAERRATERLVGIRQELGNGIAAIGTAIDGIDGIEATIGRIESLVELIERVYKKAGD